MNVILVLPNFTVNNYFGIPYSPREKNPARGGIYCLVSVPLYSFDNLKHVTDYLCDRLLGVL
jgi:hypothetical protein